MKTTTQKRGLKLGFFSVSKDEDLGGSQTTDLFFSGALLSWMVELDKGVWVDFFLQ